jgi:hypothetical protein
METRMLGNNGRCLYSLKKMADMVKTIGIKPE